MLRQCYNVAGTLIEGLLAGPEALAAVGSAYTSMVFIMSVQLRLSMGSGTAVQPKYGVGGLKGCAHTCQLSTAALLQFFKT